MGKFGLHMNFLWIIQVLGFIFILKIEFPIHFINFNSVLDWASNKPKRRGYFRRIPKTQISAARTAGLFLFSRMAQRPSYPFAGWFCTWALLENRNKPTVHSGCSLSLGNFVV